MRAEAKSRRRPGYGDFNKSSCQHYYICRGYVLLMKNLSPVAAYSFCFLTYEHKKHTTA